MKNRKASRLLTIMAFFSIYFIWGTTYLAITFALPGMKPFVLSCFRYLAAGTLLACYGIVRKLRWPDIKSIKVLVASGIIMLVGGSGLIVYGEQYINSGFAAVIIATEPLWFVVLDRSRWSLYFSNRRIIIGLLLGFAGIAMFSHFAPSDHNTLNQKGDNVMGTLIVLLSAALWVLGALYAERKLKSDSSNILNAAIQLIAAGLFSGIVALFNGEMNTFSPSQVTMREWAGLFYLIIMGSIVAYLAFTWLISVKSPAIVSTHTYVNPVVAVFIGWLIADEQIVFKQILALVIVLTGVIITQTNKKILKPG